MKISEENFLSELRKRNEKALEYVIDTYGWLVKTIVKKHMYNLESYEDDCINDIFLGIWNNIKSFDEEKNSFKNWVAAISKYKTIDYRRKYLKDLENRNIDDEIVVTEDKSHVNITKKELNKDIEDMLSCLKDKDRDLFLNIYVEEMDIADISKETGMNRDNIYNRLSRGKRKLRSIFGGVK
ncbi:sigma-70 family RNA polymerase sigma factor [Clostridium sp. B9]|uniref:sigma-70 family RNA polymerase sigma factor n=1 Tax=Clostridium sp. B9 TaxID=3423224 RepID=UPI003D2F0FB9